MIAIDPKALADLSAVLETEKRFKPFFDSLSGKGFAPEQEHYGLTRGFDGRRGPGKRAVEARKRRWGYYRKRVRGGVRPSGPYSVWTGRWIRSTYGDDAEASYVADQGKLTINTDLIRPVRNPWDLPALDRKLGAVLDRRFTLILRGKKAPARAKLSGRRSL